MNNPVTLPTGRAIPLAYVTLDVGSQRFFYGPLDVSDYLTGEQRRSFSGYDVTRANTDASNAARDQAGMTRHADGAELSYWNIAKDTATGIGNDVASAAQSLRDFVGIGPENAGKHSPLFWFVVLGGAGFVLYQVGAFAWLKKKLTT